MSVITRGRHSRLSRRARLVGAGAVFMASAFALAACSSSSGSLGGSSSASASSSASTGGTAITIGSAAFSENVILADIYGQELAKNGFTVTYKLNIGQRAAYIPALEKGEVNFIPEYAGSLLDFLNPKATASAASDVKSGLVTALPSTLEALNFSTAADSDSLNVTPAYAKAHSLVSIADLKKVGSFTFAANPEFSTRPDGVKGLKSIYGLTNLKFKAINDNGGPSTLKALLQNQVQVADIYSTTPTILANKLVTLTDPKSLFASQEVVPIVTKSLVTAKLTAVINKVSAALTTPDLQNLNNEVSGNAKMDPAAAATKFLADKGL